MEAGSWHLPGGGVREGVGRRPTGRFWEDCISCKGFGLFPKDGGLLEEDSPG